MQLKKIAVFVSGGGSNLQALLDAVKSGALPAEICLVIGSKPGIYALERAQKEGIPTAVISRSAYAESCEFDAAVIAELEKHGADYAVLAGYLSILGSAVIQRYPYRMINIHPALIPSFCGSGFYGQRVHRAVLEYGVKITGATVHFVTEGTDEGPIISQKCVPVLDGDDEHTLAARVLEAEHELLPAAASLLVQGKLQIQGRRVKIND